MCGAAAATAAKLRAEPLRAALDDMARRLGLAPQGGRDADARGIRRRAARTRGLSRRSPPGNARSCA